MEIIPAILTDDPTEFEELVGEIAKSGRFSRVQVDFIDGEYAANKTVGVEMCKSIKNYPQIKFDARLMVVQKNLGEYVEEAKRQGFDRIIPQVESISRPEEFDCLAIDFHSPVQVLEPYLPRLKYVLVMAVEPGFGGQEFDFLTLDRVRQIGQIRHINDYKYKIGVDGGVEKEHLSVLENLGGDEVAGVANRVLEC